MKHLYRIGLLFLGMFVLTNFGNAQNVLLYEDFETDGNGTRYTTSVAEFSDGFGDYYTNVINNTISTPGFVNSQGSGYFAAQDTDGDGQPDLITQDFTGIDINNYTNLELSFFIAEDDDGSNQDWDSNTEFLIQYQIDGGGFVDIFRVTGTGTNTAPLVDSDLDGTGDGTEITNVFTEFTEAIGSTGTSLDLRITVNFLDAGDEDIAWDEITITGNSTTDVSDPVFENSTPSVANITSTTGDLNVDLDEGGTVYYIVEATPSTSPSVAQVMALTDGNDATPFIENTVTVADIGDRSFTETLSGLTTDTEYIVHVVAQDFAATPNVIDAVQSVTFTATDATAPEFASAATATASTTSNVVLTFTEPVTTTDETGFSVSIGGIGATIIGVAGSGTDELTFTLSETIAKNSGTILISYDGSGDAADGASNGLTTFTDEAVTNNASTSIVADIANARALSSGENVRITGEVVISYLTGNSRDQIFIQDATGGLLIDDNDPVITTSYNAGDGIINFEGTLGAFGGVTQIVPLLDPGTANSTGNTITPQVVAIDVFNAALDDYESELLSLQEITFTNADGSTAFGDPTSDYSTISDGVNTTTFDADGFLGIDYSTETIPYGRLDLIVLGRENNGTPIVTSRSLTDIQDNYAPIFTSAPSASNLTVEGADITFQADEPGTVYYFVVADGTTPTPTTAEVIAENNSQAYTDVASDVVVTITGLADNTPFDVYVVAADDESTPNEQDAPVLVEFSTNEIVFDANSDITALASPITLTDISSLADTDVEAVDVFGFTLTDEGTDLQSTLVETMVITAGTNNTADWSTTLGGAVLTDGVTDYPMTIAAGTLTLDLSGSEYDLANASSQEFTLSVWFNTAVTDGEILEFEIPADHSFTALITGSVFADPVTAAVTSAQHTVDVTATDLVLDYASLVGVAEDFSLTVTAEDANGNVDLASRDVSISKTSGTGDLTGTGLTGQAMTSGAFTWSDLQLSAADSYVLTVDDDGSALTADANIEAQVVVNDAAQLLITEVAVTPTGGEFVEIYNNSGSTVLLEDYYLTDATFAGGSTYYYNIVTGSNAGGGDFADWHARFPAGSVIADGEVQTVSLAGSEDFFSAYGIQPDYELFEDGASADAIPDMLEALTGSINDQGGLTDGGEMVMLYYWDGTTDLVTDIDYVMWGDQNEAIDKTGISIDGPDGDSDATAYQDDLTTTSQAIIAASAHASGNSWQRSDFDEGTETKTGGNGVDGHNEMTEDLSNTFFENTANPGEIIEPGSPLITLTTTSFEGAFGFVELGQSSDVSSYDVTANDLTADLVITPPEGFEIAAEMDFSGTVYTNSSAWTLTPTDGSVSQTVYVRFTPLAADVVYSGDITHTSTDADPKTVGVSGTEGVFDTAPSISGVVFNEILPDPNFTGTGGYDTDGNGEANTEDEFVELYNTSGSDVDISGWQLWDESGMFFEFPATTTLGAGNYVGVMAEVQDGGTLPTPSTGNLAFEVAGSMSLSNGGENVALYDPIAGEYIQIKYGDGESDANIGANLSGATLNGIIEDWGGDEDGSSLVREPAGDLNIVIHSEIEGALAASFAEPTIDPDAPLISIDDASFNPNFGNVVVGEESATSSYSVSGTNLEADIVITAPANFEISQDGSSFSSSITLSPTANEVSATTITVKYIPSATGSQDGTITHTSSNAITNELDVIGTGVTASTIFFEGFGSCDALNTFASQSVSGDNVWECTDEGETGAGVSITGFSFDVFEGVANEDWLVSPAIDLTSIDGAQLSFDSDIEFDGSGEMTVLFSTNYVDDVTTADWTELSATYDTDEVADTWVSSGSINLAGGSSIRIAFRYISSDDENGAVEYRIDNVLIEERVPELIVDDSEFNGDFGQQDVGTASINASFTVEGFGLSNNVTVTPPAQFEVATNSNFNDAGTSASPLTITVTDGTVDQEVFVRFAPSAAGNFSGNVTVASAPFESVTLAVSGVGEEEDTTLGLEDELEIIVYPNPIQDAFQVANKTGKKISIEVFALDGARMQVNKTGDVYSIATLNTGVYVLVVKDEDSNELARQQIIKQ